MGNEDRRINKESVTRNETIKEREKHKKPTPEKKLLTSQMEEINQKILAKEDSL